MQQITPKKITKMKSKQGPDNALRPLLRWLSLAVMLAVTACSASKYVPEGELFYKGVNKIEVHDQDKEFPRHASKTLSEVEKAIKVPPNGSLFGHHKYRLPFTYGFYVNERLENDSTFLGKWIYKTFGAKPKFISTVNPSGRTTIARQLLQENGYFYSDVLYDLELSKDSLQAYINYDIVMGEPHVIDSVEHLVDIVPLDSTNLFDPKETILKKGMPFSVVTLEEERNRISDLLRSKGFYFFKPSNIIYEADSTIQPKKVHLRMKLSDKMDPRAYQPWYIGKLSYNIYNSSISALTDSLYIDDVLVRYSGKLPIRQRVLRNKIHFQKDSLYNVMYQNRTVSSLATLNTFAYSDVTYTPSDSLPNHLDVQLTSQVDLPYYTELETVFKSKSNNQVGPGISLTLNKKNIFRGGELLSLQLGANYEWETQRKRRVGNSWDINSYGLDLSTTLTFPRILLPYFGKRFHDFPATTSVSVSAGILNRASFYRVGQFSGRFSYHFEPRRGMKHTITPLRMTYNLLMRGTPRFDSIMIENPALALSFQDQFVPSMGYTFGYEMIDPDSPHNFSLEASVSEAGNLLSGIYYLRGYPFNEQKEFFNSPFAQFVKGSLELRYGYQINSKHKIATRLFGGAVYSYGNMLVAPYFEQFYSGGANSIRAFNVRSLGPGSYRPQEYDLYTFMDRTGDIRLEANLEYRYKMFGSLELATFLDAGNIWLMREDPSRPGGTMNGARFLNDIALGTGLGFRYDLSYLVLRLDLGVALHAPYDTGVNGYFNTLRKEIWKDAFALHLSIGYPF